MSWQRARRPEQKAERKQAIVAAAATLLEQHPLDEVTLAAIAEGAGLSKANLYRYFESREEIVLQVVFADLEAWVEAMAEPFETLAGSDDPAGVGALIAGSLADRPRLAELIGKVSSVLERNLSREAVLAVKVRMFEQMTRAGGMILQALPSLDAQRLPEFFIYLQVILTGIWPAAHPTDVVAEVMSRPEFSGSKVEYARDLERLITTVLAGMMRDG